MLSVILYGRNDNYGYNLHKRAALSLNCISEILDHPDDELIFVDYNTPDDLPTFPEAIQDTLTSQARARLRILRVRPEVHERFCEKTHLLALEPVARNVALRRSNSANRWVLSTNTDMLFVPRNGASISRVLGDLPDGLYHLPRFEIPETLWETFDRRDATGVLAAVECWSRDARLNEVVYGDPAILYDGPGDFQLAPREAYFEIDGFDERMLLGWHVDSNLAKRFALKLGPPRSFLEHLFGYHCDHTRMATPAHRRDRLQNDPIRFFNCVDRADIPEQKGIWGCPDAAVEEIRLTGAETDYARMLKRRVSPLHVPYTESFYTASSYDQLWYDPGHVLPFVADLFAAAPRSWSVGWYGCRPLTFSLFTQAWQDLGFTGKILLTERSADLAGEPPPCVVVCNDATIQGEAQAFVFEVGLRAHDQSAHAPPLRSTNFSDEDVKRLQAVRNGFRELVGAERRRLASPHSQARRFIFINAIHNRFEELVTKHINITLTPFSSRTRHGYVYLDGPAAAQPANGRGIVIDGVNLGLTSAEVRYLVEAAREALLELELQGENFGRALSAAEQVLQLLRQEDAAALIGANPEQINRLCRFLESERPSSKHPLLPRFRYQDPVERPEKRALTRAAEFHDWNSPSWLSWVETLTDTLEPQLSAKRSAWLWEKAHVLFGLARAGMLVRERRGLLAAVVPDRVLGPLTEHAGQIDLVSLVPVEPGPGELQVAIGPWADNWHIEPNRVRMLGSPELRELKPDSYDFVLFPHSAICVRGSSGFVGYLADAARLLRRGGRLVFTADVPVAETANAELEHWYLPVDPAFWAKVSDHLGLKADAPLSVFLSRATMDRVWETEQPIPGMNYFVSRDSGGLLLLRTAWFLEKIGEGDVRSGKNLRELTKLAAKAGLRSEPRKAGQGADATGPGSLSRSEIRRLVRIVQRALHAQADDELPLAQAAMFAEPLLGHLESASAPTVFQCSAQDLQLLAGKIEQARTSTQLESIEPFEIAARVAPSRERGLTRGAEYFDWESPEWLRWVEAVSSSILEARSFDTRSSWLWERAHVPYGLTRLGVLNRNSAGLVAAVLPDRIIGVLGHAAGRLDVLPLAELEGGSSPAHWAEAAGFDERQVTVLPSETRMRSLKPGSYDFVLFPHSAICLHGVDGFIRFLADAGRLLRPGGQLVFAADVPVGQPAGAELEHWYPPVESGFWSQVADDLGLELDGPFDGALSRATVDRCWETDKPTPGMNYFLYRDSGGMLLIRSTWFLKKAAEPKTSAALIGTESASRVFRRAAARAVRLLTRGRKAYSRSIRRTGMPFGVTEKLSAMRLGENAVREEDGIRVRRGREAHAVFGPYEMLPPGTYRIKFAFSDLQCEAEAKLVIEVVSGPAYLLREDLPVPDLANIVERTFRVPDPGGRAQAPLEYRVWTNGRLTMVITSIQVDPDP